ncbi:MAG: ABC transporter ATP-binding protein, partial [Phascolarctobacterium sp.]
IKRLSRVIGNIQRAMAAAQRVFDVLDLPETIKNLPEAKALPTVKGQVSFNNVSFSYNPGEQVLNNVSFNVKPGEMIAFVGPSGAGKSTVASLLPRFYDVTDGSITIDGEDIRRVTLDSLREQVGIVPQETVLFNGSVYDNILYGRLDATKEEVEAAAKAANAHNFIMELPNGYQTMLGDRGVNISGGQRQRISIARAILKNPQILILDEATSALDTESERVVQEALDRLMIGRTSFVIAHRLSTIKNADKIMVLEKGTLAEMGTHEELMAKDGLYAHLYKIQYRSKETH